MRTNWREFGLAAIALWVILAGSSVQAASRFGGLTDDSVCDVGNTAYRVKPVDIPAEEFIKTKCKNGQVLLGISIVPIGKSLPEIEFLAKRYCKIADIKTWRTMENLGGVAYEHGNARCVIEKLGKEEKQ